MTELRTELVSAALANALAAGSGVTLSSGPRRPELGQRLSESSSASLKAS